MDGPPAATVIRRAAGQEPGPEQPSLPITHVQRVQSRGMILLVAIFAEEHGLGEVVVGTVLQGAQVVRPPGAASVDPCARRWRALWTRKVVA